MSDFFRRFLIVWFSVVITAYAQTSNRALASPLSSDTSPDLTGYAGDQACAGCHSSIYAAYSKTSMARASGPASDNLIPADFTHQQSGVHFRIYKGDGKAWLSFERPKDSEVQGRRQLLYYIGSGRRGRSYLFATDGFLFESPVNWYMNRQLWDMAPAYGEGSHIPMTLPAFTSCLHCHFTGVKPPAKGTENRYPLPPFISAGVSCEACHGPGAAHVKGGAIVNPAKLDPVRRDAVCMQCHLEGKAAVEKAGKHIYDFRPGQQLSDFIRYFVFADHKGSGLGAVSQFEALAQSACKKKSGDAMTCTTCHDPHSEPSAAERVAYYRQKCLACHGGKIDTKHHAAEPDCSACHMPSSLSTDVAHTEVTDHRIPRRPQMSSQLLADAASAPPLPELVGFPPAQKEHEELRDGDREKYDRRELALAWESLVDHGMAPAAAPAAEQKLRAALQQSPNDPALLSALGYSAQKKGELEQAREYYEKALAIDPTLIDAAANLGAIEVNRGSLREGLRLWEQAFQRAPGQSGIGINIARVLCEDKQFDSARDYLLRVLQFNPDLPDAKSLMKSLNRSDPKCSN